MEVRERGHGRTPEPDAHEASAVPVEVVVVVTVRRTAHGVVRPVNPNCLDHVAMEKADRDRAWAGAPSREAPTARELSVHGPSLKASRTTSTHVKLEIRVFARDLDAAHPLDASTRIWRGGSDLGAKGWRR